MLFCGHSGCHRSRAKNWSGRQIGANYSSNILDENGGGKVRDARKREVAGCARELSGSTRDWTRGMNWPVVTSIAPVSTTVKVPCWFVNVTVSINDATVPETPVMVRFPAMVPCNNPPPMTFGGRATSAEILPDCLCINQVTGGCRTTRHLCSQFAAWTSRASRLLPEKIARTLGLQSLCAGRLLPQMRFAVGTIRAIAVRCQ